jgi:outer membrane immunogenic protein
MFDGTGVSGNHLYPPLPSTETLGFNDKWFGTVTGRIGYAVLPQALVYFKGGAAEARIDYTDADPTAPYSGTASATRTGWTIGGGAEYAFAHNWSVFVEYDYMNFGSSNTTLTYTSPNPALATPYTYTETHALQTVLVGLNYRFGMH